MKDHCYILFRSIISLSFSVFQSNTIYVSFSLHIFCPSLLTISVSLFSHFLLECLILSHILTLSLLNTHPFSVTHIRSLSFAVRRSHTIYVSLFLSLHIFCLRVSFSLSLSFSHTYTHTHNPFLSLRHSIWVNFSGLDCKQRNTDSQAKETKISISNF